MLFLVDMLDAGNSMWALSANNMTLLRQGLAMNTSQNDNRVGKQKNTKYEVKMLGNTFS